MMQRMKTQTPNKVKQSNSNNANQLKRPQSAHASRPVQTPVKSEYIDREATKTPISYGGWIKPRVITPADPMIPGTIPHINVDSVVSPSVAKWQLEQQQHQQLLEQQQQQQYINPYNDKQYIPNTSTYVQVQPQAPTPTPIVSNPTTNPIIQYQKQELASQIHGVEREINRMVDDGNKRLLLRQLNDLRQQLSMLNTTKTQQQQQQQQQQVNVDVYGGLLKGRDTNNLPVELQYTSEVLSVPTHTQLPHHPYINNNNNHNPRYINNNNNKGSSVYSASEIDNTIVTDGIVIDNYKDIHYMNNSRSTNTVPVPTSELYNNNIATTSTATYGNINRPTTTRSNNGDITSTSTSTPMTRGITLNNNNVPRNTVVGSLHGESNLVKAYNNGVQSNPNTNQQAVLRMNTQNQKQQQNQNQMNPQNINIGINAVVTNQSIGTVSGVTGLQNPMNTNGVGVSVGPIKALVSANRVIPIVNNNNNNNSNNSVYIDGNNIRANIEHTKLRLQQQYYPQQQQQQQHHQGGSYMLLGNIPDTTVITDSNNSNNKNNNLRNNLINNNILPPQMNVYKNNTSDMGVEQMYDYSNSGHRVIAQEYIDQYSNMYSNTSNYNTNVNANANVATPLHQYVVQSVASDLNAFNDPNHHTLPDSHHSIHTVQDAGEYITSNASYGINNNGIVGGVGGGDLRVRVSTPAQQRQLNRKQSQRSSGVAAIFSDDSNSSNNKNINNTCQPLLRGKLYQNEGKILQHFTNNDHIAVNAVITARQNELNQNNYPHNLTYHNNANNNVSNLKNIVAGETDEIVVVNNTRLNQQLQQPTPLQQQQNTVYGMRTPHHGMMQGTNARNESSLVPHPTGNGIVGNFNAGSDYDIVYDHEMKNRGHTYSDGHYNNGPCIETTNINNNNRYSNNYTNICPNTNNNDNNNETGFNVPTSNSEYGSFATEREPPVSFNQASRGISLALAPSKNNISNQPDVNVPKQYTNNTRPKSAVSTPIKKQHTSVRQTASEYHSSIERQLQHDHPPPTHAYTRKKFTSINTVVTKTPQKLLEPGPYYTVDRFGTKCFVGAPVGTGSSVRKDKPSLAPETVVGAKIKSHIDNPHFQIYR